MILLLNHQVLRWLASAWQGKTHFSKFIMKLLGLSELLCLTGNSGICATLPVHHIVIAESNEKSQRDMITGQIYLRLLYFAGLNFPTPLVFFSYAVSHLLFFSRLMTLHLQYLAQSLWRWYDIMITFSLKSPQMLSREQQEYHQRRDGAHKHRPNSLKLQLMNLWQALNEAVELRWGCIRAHTHLHNSIHLFLSTHSLKTPLMTPAVQRDAMFSRLFGCRAAAVHQVIFEESLSTSLALDSNELRVVVFAFLIEAPLERPALWCQESRKRSQGM